MPNPPNPGIPPALAFARILRVALVVSVVLYGVLSMVLRDRVGAEDLPGATHAALHVVAGVLVLLGVWLFRRMESAGPRASSREAGDRPALPPMMVAGWSLFEAVGLLGLVVSLLGGTGQVLVLVSLLLLLLHPPRLEWFS